ncbi:hypothetical protein H4R20_000954 [Coemansia guatemalensis]|uniref:Uncharacterized protein n=1 Tax=Coemansia guatemalensis TaxID=2761395 RepID=A0A9W8I6S5_9FUNG|nr:hypothetical protein H4R20_000954 [Coemansia guatemalensis]
MSTASRPLLQPLWPGAKLYLSKGRANVLLSLDGGLMAWACTVVVDFDCTWEVLVGKDMLECLGIRLMTPAMQLHMDSEHRTPDHLAKSMDSNHTVKASCTPCEEDYEEMPDTTHTWDLAFPSPTEASPAALTVAEPVVSCPMWACLGLPVHFFIPQCDDEFLALNTLYPETTKASVKEQLHHQCPSLALMQELLTMLMLGKDVM